MKKINTLHNETQLSLFDSLFESTKVEYKSSYTSEELKSMVLYGDRWEKDFILYFHDDEHTSYDTWHLVTDLALLNNNMVYIKDQYLYPFMYKFNNYKEAERFYLRKKQEAEKSFALSQEPFKKGSVIKSIKSDTPNFEDVYFFKSATEEAYSVKEYVDKINHGYVISV